MPAGWIACRRCGAPLTVERPPEAKGNALPRRSALTGAAPTATLAAPAARAAAPPSMSPPRSSSAPLRDTLLPGDNADTLVSATARTRSRANHRTHLAAACLAAGTVALIVWAIVSATSDGSSTGSDPRLRAETLVRRAAGAAAPLYSSQKSFTTLKPSALAHASGLEIVAGDTNAQSGAISIKTASTTTLILATPASKTACLFGRDDAGDVKFAITASRQCRAALAPQDGWGSG